MGNNYDELFQGERNVTDAEPFEWSYEQFVQAVQQDTVKSVTVYRAQVTAPSDSTRAVIQTNVGNTHFVDLPADSSWMSLLEEHSVKLTTMERGQDFEMKIFKSLILPVVFLIGLFIWLKTFGK